MSRSSFSVAYKDPDRSDCCCSVDWWGGKRGGWVPVSKSIGGSEWYPESDKKLNQLAYKAILKKFRLVKLSSELPMEKVQTMSPAELMSWRTARFLPKIVALNDIGEPRVRAEEYE